MSDVSDELDQHIQGIVTESSAMTPSLKTIDLCIEYMCLSRGSVATIVKAYLYPTE